VDTYEFLPDPRALTLPERQRALARMQREQSFWLDRLGDLTEAPKPERDFPAFLLATPAFRDLAHKLLLATARHELPTDVADELDWFVRAFAEYLRSAAGEDVFSASHRGSAQY
jgi:hypothetical protein